MVGESNGPNSRTCVLVFSPELWHQPCEGQGNIFMNLQTYGNRIWSGPLDVWLNEICKLNKKLDFYSCISSQDRGFSNLTYSHKIHLQMSLPSIQFSSFSLFTFFFRLWCFLNLDLLLPPHKTSPIHFHSRTWQRTCETIIKTFWQSFCQLISTIIVKCSKRDDYQILCQSFC